MRNSTRFHQEFISATERYDQIVSAPHSFSVIEGHLAAIDLHCLEGYFGAAALEQYESRLVSYRATCASVAHDDTYV